MNFKTLKQAIDITRRANISLNIWGHRGIGKSSILEQYCSSLRFGCINMRLSQKEAPDIRGLPDKVDGYTIYATPGDMPRGGMSWDEYCDKLAAAPEAERRQLALKLTPFLNEGILFFDEVNRAQDDVIQCIFELLNERRVGQYALPAGWSIVCAGNFNEGSYITNGFTDAAFLDRFCHVTLSDGEPTLEEWVAYMSATHGEAASTVIEFTTQDLNRLDGQVEGDLGFSIQPSRRSWDAVARVMSVCEEQPYDEEARIGVIQGLVGMELGLTFGRYDCPVKPRDIINDGVKKWAKKMAGLNRGQLVGLMWGLTSYLKGSIDEEKSSHIALDFAEWMATTSTEHDLIGAFLKSLVRSDENKIVGDLKSVMITNPKAAKILQGVINGKKKGKTFLDRLMENEPLHDIISKMSWGVETE